MKYIGDKERDNAPKYSLHGHVFGYPTDNIYIKTHRRGNQTYLAHPDDEYPEPYRIKIQRQNQGEENGYGKQHHGQGVHNSAEQQIEDQDNSQDDIAVYRQGTDGGGQFIGQPAYRQEVAENHSAQDNDKYHGRGLAGIKEAILKGQPGKLSPGNSENESAGGTNTGRLNRAEPSQIKTTHNHHPRALERDYLLPESRPRAGRTHEGIVLAEKINGKEVEDSLQNAGDNAGQEKLAYGLLGDNSVQDKDGLWTPR